MYCKSDRDWPGKQARLMPVQQPKAEPIKICILGGGFGGLYTALYLQQSLKQRSPSYEITLVEQKDHFVFTPLLYERVTGELQPWEVGPTYLDLLHNTNIQFNRSTIDRVDLAARQVYLQTGERLDYDYLVLAVGGQNRLDQVPGAAAYAYSFRTVLDAEHLRERLRFLEASERTQIRIAIAGGGPSGVELACKLADRLQARGQIRLIERGDQLLKTFSSGSRAAAYRALKMRRVQVDLNTGIDAIAPDQITLTAQGQTCSWDVDLVLWTAGTQVIDWVKDLTCSHNAQGQVISRPTLQLAEYPEVFALGDLAEIQDGSGNRVPATAQAAYQQASRAAKNLKAAIAGHPLKAFRYLHLGEMLTLGTNAAVLSSFGITIDGLLACIARRLIYLYRMPTWPHRVRVLAHWIKHAIAKSLPKPLRKVARVWPKAKQHQHSNKTYPRRVHY